jgi:hypothetical protein
MMDDRLLARLAALDDEAAPEAAPARLKSRIYSALVERMADEAPLRPLTASQADGERLCVFERSLTLMPDDRITTRNPCRVCHARVLGERLERAPIFWPGCPYAAFHRP